MFCVEKGFSWCPTRLYLGPLIFLAFINDLPYSLQSIVRIFADNISLFSVKIDNLGSSNLLNIYLELIGDWAFQCYLIQTLLNKEIK